MRVRDRRFACYVSTRFCSSGLSPAAAFSVAAGKVWLPWSAWTFDDPRWLIVVELRVPRRCWHSSLALRSGFPAQRCRAI